MGNPDWRIKMTLNSDSFYVAVPAWHAFLASALPTLGPDTWYSEPVGLVNAYGYYYLPGTQPRANPGSLTSGRTTSGGGGGGKKKKK